MRPLVAHASDATHVARGVWVRQGELAEAKVAGEGLVGEKHAWGVARAELQAKLDRANADIERLTKVRDFVLRGCLRL